jgi:hypothetical protein
MKTPSVETITVSEAANLFEKYEVISALEHGGMLVTLLKGEMSDFYLVQGSGDDFLHISA